ncbi:unnamed protein product [Caenorhabditis nigoni]
MRNLENFFSSSPVLKSLKLWTTKSLDPFNPESKFYQTESIEVQQLRHTFPDLLKYFQGKQAFISCGRCKILDLIEFVNKWKSGEGFRKLEYLEMKIVCHDVPENLILNGIGPKYIDATKQPPRHQVPKVITLNYDFIMSRLQFPVRLSFAMTVNKSQRQTFEEIETIDDLKYLYKYVYKGTTRASIVIKIDENGKERQEIDEIKQYLDTRYVCAPEAVHHLLGFPMSQRSVSVEAVDRADSRNTSLTAWFEINQKCKDAVLPDGSFPKSLRDSRNYFYHEMPEQFRLVSGVWHSRKTKEFSLGRMYFISPRNREKFALPQLLLYTKGSTSFEDLRTVNGHVWHTFVEAARASGYLSDNSVYEKTIQEAANFHSPSQIRGLFVTLLLFESIDNCEALWSK